MPQVIRCPHCTKAIQVPDNAGGKQVTLHDENRQDKPIKIEHARQADKVGAVYIV